MSYNTVEQADAYIAGHYLSSDELAQQWSSLSEDDKQVLLTRAHDTIDALPITGRKTDVAQPNAFPRYLCHLVTKKLMQALPTTARWLTMVFSPTRLVTLARRCFRTVKTA